MSGAGKQLRTSVQKPRKGQAVMTIDLGTVDPQVIREAIATLESLARFAEHRQTSLGVDLDRGRSVVDRVLSTWPDDQNRVTR